MKLIVLALMAPLTALAASDYRATIPKDRMNPIEAEIAALMERSRTGEFATNLLEEMQAIQPEGQEEGPEKEFVEFYATPKTTDQALTKLEQIYGAPDSSAEVSTKILQNKRRLHSLSFFGEAFSFYGGPEFAPYGAIKALMRDHRRQLPKVKNGPARLQKVLRAYVDPRRFSSGIATLLRLSVLRDAAAKKLFRAPADFELKVGELRDTIIRQRKALQAHSVVVPEGAPLSDDQARRMLLNLTKELQIVEDLRPRYEALLRLTDLKF